MGSPPEVFKGDFESDLLRLAHGGPGMHARLTYDVSEAGYLATSMEMSENGAAWKRFLTGASSASEPGQKSDYSYFVRRDSLTSGCVVASAVLRRLLASVPAWEEDAPRRAHATAARSHAPQR